MSIPSTTATFYALPATPASAISAANTQAPLQVGINRKHSHIQFLQNQQSLQNQNQGTSAPIASTATTPAPPSASSSYTEKAKNALLDWNLSKWVPLLGIASGLAWGSSNILEHKLQDGHLTRKPLVALALAAPAINVVYGLLNTLGAAAQGYSIRTLAFSGFSLFSLAMLPLMMRDSHIAREVAERVGKGKFSESLTQLAKEGLKYRRFSSLYNAIAPIGMLTGLFSITKVAQSTPGVTLEHPTGNTLREMQLNAPTGKKMTDILARNFRTEWGSFWNILKDLPQQVRETAGSFKQAWQNFAHPSPETSDQNPISRFMQPLTEGQAVPFFYSKATTGRILSSTLAAALFFWVNKQGLIKHTIYHTAQGIKPTEFAAANAKNATQTWLGRGVNAALIIGNLTGAPASLFTKFNDWPGFLSMAYRTSGIAYGISALSSLGSIFGKKFQPFHLDEWTWTKVGSFIQVTSYFVNLFLKNQNKGSHPPPTAASGIPSTITNPTPVGQQPTTATPAQVALPQTASQSSSNILPPSAPHAEQGSGNHPVHANPFGASAITRPFVLLSSQQRSASS